MSVLSAIRGFKSLLFNSQSAPIEADPFAQGFKANDKNLLLQLDKSLIIAFYLTKCKNSLSHESDQMQMTVEKILQGIYRQTKLDTDCVIELACEQMLNGLCYPAKYVIFDNRKQPKQEESAGAIQLPTYTTINQLINKYAKPPLVTHVPLGDIPANTALFVNYKIIFKNGNTSSGTIHGIPKSIVDRINDSHDRNKGAIVSFEARLACEPIVGDPRYPKGAIVYEYKSEEATKYPTVTLKPEQLDSIFYDTKSCFRIVKIKPSGARDITIFRYKLLGDAIRQSQNLASGNEYDYIQVIVNTLLQGVEPNAIIWDSRNKRPVST